MHTWRVVFSSHGNGRKTHIAYDEGEALCRAEHRYPHLLFEQGDRRPWTELPTYINGDFDNELCGHCLNVIGSA